MPALLKCKQFPIQEIPRFKDVDEWLAWLDEVYIPGEPSRLGPGAMSNAPDRLDGFHTYNRCCRSTADKGRSKTNLASYSTDRRVFEYWVDGNWVEANKTMGLFASDPEVGKITCVNDAGYGNHPIPCSADHIGPISLGFAHRPSFQPLCTPCNSAKNNRMTILDIEKLIEAEKSGITVASWYAAPVWNQLKSRTTTNDDALKLSRVMRDNRHNAMTALGNLLDGGCFVFLCSFLNLDYASYTYELVNWSYSDGVLDAEFDSKESSLQYTKIQKARRLRVAFQALRDYKSKENRNGLLIEGSSIDLLMKQAIDSAQRFEYEYVELNEELADLFESDYEDSEMLKQVTTKLPCKDDYMDSENYKEALRCLNELMNTVGGSLAAMWDDLRYTRTNYDS